MTELDHDHDHDYVRTWRRWVLAIVVAAVASACTSAPMCTPDAGVVCCTEGDTRECVDDGAPGLQACGRSGFWSTCVAFMDAGPQDHQVFQDTGGLPDFGRVDH